MKRRIILMSLFAMFLAVTSVFGQDLTNSGINGQIPDGKGETMPGATVLVVHQLSRTQYGTVFDNSGCFYLPVPDVGGPYCHQPKGRGEQDPEEMIVSRLHKPQCYAFGPSRVTDN